MNVPLQHNNCPKQLQFTRKLLNWLPENIAVTKTYKITVQLQLHGSVSESYGVVRV